MKKDPEGINPAQCRTASEGKAALEGSGIFTVSAELWLLASSYAWVHRKQSGVAWLMFNKKQYYNYIIKCAEERIPNPSS